MKLRLILTQECNRKCKGCCNKDWDLNNLPKCTSYIGYNEILITGGEPLLNIRLLKQTIKQIKHESPNTPIYLYTAWNENYLDIFDLLCNYVDGITLTLHSKKDLFSFKNLNRAIIDWDINNKSLRLNVFKGIPLIDVDLSMWKVKNMKWIKNCPLPKDEILMQL